MSVRPGHEICCVTFRLLSKCSPTMSIEELVQSVREFRDERDWRRFHTPKDLAAAIAIEAGELQELFLWKLGSAEGEVLEHRRSEVEEELADIAIFLLSFVDVAGIDLAAAIQAKLQKNALRYPVETYRGSNAKAPPA
jgi:dCTP diphosphatase